MNVPAVILAGGLGTRLRHVLGDLPKALAPVAGRPFLAYQLDWLKKQEVTRVVLCTGYCHELIAAYCGDGSAWARSGGGPRREWSSSTW